MKQRLLFLLMTLFSAIIARADVQINETTFPDENFRNWVLSQEYGYDGVLTDAEIGGVFVIQVYNMEIQTLKGIEYFIALEYLTCYNNQLTSLDVSNNTALTELTCSNNQLTSLDVSNNTALTGLAICQNQIKDDAMDALVNSLPTIFGYIYVIYDENEQNVMTTDQVAAAKAKGWTPLYYDGEKLGSVSWL